MNSPNSSKPTDIPVLIVGGGPVGLGLALELASRQICCTLIEKGDGVVRLSKMGHVSVRSMEHCRRWGVAEAVRNVPFPRDYPADQVFCTSLTGRHVTTLKYPSKDQELSNAFSPEQKQRCPQLWFDPILAKSAAQNSAIELRYGTQLESFLQDADGVTAQLRDLGSGRLNTMRARYMVGCDGAGSVVRQALGIEYEGDPVLSYSVGIYFTARDLVQHHPMGAASRYWLIGPEGTWGNLTVVDGKDLWRLTITGSQEKVEAKDFDADHWLRRCLGSDAISYHIDAVLPWRRSRLVARKYGSGRVFLAGDACHLNAPNGGYGMNTGLGDAVDIGWKLAATLQGWGGPKLLASYETERRPVAQRNVDAAAQNFGSTRPSVSYTHVEEAGAEGERTREALSAHMNSNTRQEWETLGVHLGYRYEGSPIIWADGTAEPADHLSDYVPTARPGHRAPHVFLSEGNSILDLFGQGFVLLDFSSADGASIDAAPLREAASRLGIPFAVHNIANAEAATLYERRLVLVRPDGHVAWRGDELDIDSESLWRMVTGWQEEEDRRGAHERSQSGVPA